MGPLDTQAIVERLQSIEEDLRDLAYDRLRESLDTKAVLTEERRLHKARQAVAKAIHLLEGAPAEAEADAD
ncbi:MAG: hypothetical protein ACRDZ3_10980 [Acidimicrobiia bacterium]